MGSYSFLSCAISTHFILPIMEAELESLISTLDPWKHSMTVHLIVKLALPIANTLGSLSDINTYELKQPCWWTAAC